MRSAAAPSHPAGYVRVAKGHALFGVTWLENRGLEVSRLHSDKILVISPVSELHRGSAPQVQLAQSEDEGVELRRGSLRHGLWL